MGKSREEEIKGRGKRQLYVQFKEHLEECTREDESEWGDGRARTSKEYEGVILGSGGRATPLIVGASESWIKARHYLDLECRNPLPTRILLSHSPRSRSLHHADLNAQSEEVSHRGGGEREWGEGSTSSLCSAGQRGERLACTVA